MEEFSRRPCVVGRLGAGSLRPIPMWVCAPFPEKPYSSVERRKPFTRKRRQRRWGFAPCTRESLIPPLRGANLLPGRATGGGGGLRLISRKALFFRREAQTFCREKPRRLCEFAPYTRESLILPSRGANFLPGRATGGGGGLRLIPGKALFFRRGAQTFCREKPPAAVRVCASHPGKPYSSVEGRKPFTGKSPRRL